ncbi:MAG: glycosyltransferase family 9 protein [Deltaproteobacteria bacterium]|nr:glycosyltransferase family 9 protein [Deltaproteobacteria bacterium]
MKTTWRSGTGRLLLLGLDGLFQARHRECSARPGGRRRILVVRLDAFGDFLLWTPSARRLRKLYPPETHELVLAANRLWAGLAAETGWFDRVIPVTSERLVSRPSYRWQTWRILRAVGADVCLQPTFSRRFLVGDAAVRASGALERVGSAGDLANRTEGERRLGDAWYTRLLPAAAGHLHELERNAEVLRGLGDAEAKVEAPLLPGEGALPQGFGADPWYVLFVGGSVARKRWPAERLARLAEQIYAVIGLRAVIGGGAGEEAIGERVREISDAPLENWVGRTSLRELTAVVRHARFVVTNDTGAVHLAAATGTPAVCVVGGGHFGRFLPYPEVEFGNRPVPIPVFHRMPCFDCDWRCIYPLGSEEASPCVAEVSMEDVWRALGKIAADQQSKAPQGQRMGEAPPL